MTCFMYNDISILSNGRGRIFLDTHLRTLFLMSAFMPGYCFEDMADIWAISGTYISMMYAASHKSRKGFG